MQATAIKHFGPVTARPDTPSAQDRLLESLDKLRAKLDAADDTRFADMPRLLDEMMQQCDRARGAALLLFPEAR
jgi:hypothetical protein